MSFEALSDYTVVSKYARYLPELKRRESWDESVTRVKNMHLTKYPDMKEEIDFAFSHVYDKLVLPSMRSMQFGGEPILKRNAKLYNCISSYCDRPRFFQECLWLLLNGCGTGFSVQKHHVAKLPSFHEGLNSPSDLSEEIIYVVEDSIEGWADALGVLVASYMPHPEFKEFYGKLVRFDYSKIRQKGSPLSFGIGKAPGPDPLSKALKHIRDIFNNCLKFEIKRLRPIDAYDIIMHASNAVLSGGVRRSACLAIFSLDDDEMMNAKTGDWFYANSQRGRSNNSILLIRNQTTKEQYHEIFEKTRQFGEPGIIWSDSYEALYNPCVEVGLYGYNRSLISGWQACNLTTMNGSRLTSKALFALASEVSAIIGTLQAGYTDFAYLGAISEEIIRQEALLGCSITGIMDNPEIILVPETLREMSQLILDKNLHIAAKIGINPASRLNVVKPEGTASCVLGTAGSGIHPAHAERYFRRVQANANEATVEHYETYNRSAVEKSVWGADDKIINFLVESNSKILTKDQVNAVQLLGYVKMMQENWVNSGKRPELCVQPWLSHNVSNTINVAPDLWKDVEDYIFENRNYFAGISMLADTGDLDYQQAPFTKVLTLDEIVAKYGKGSLLASGLIVDALHAFDDNLWKACDALLGVFDIMPPTPLTIINESSIEKLARDWKTHTLQKDWVRRAKQFANRYVNNDIKELTYMLKNINNYKSWEDLSREYIPVNWELLYEEDDNTKLTESVACAGGACNLV